LVAAVVVFTVLFVVATIFAIYYGVQDSKAEDSLTAIQTRYRQIAVDLTTPEATELIGWAHSDGALPEPTALAEAIRERDQLRQMILGEQPAAATDQAVDTATQTGVNDVITEAQKAVAAANTILGAGGAKMSADSLVQAISDLSSAVQSLNRAASAAIAERDAARQQAAKDEQAATDTQAKADQTINDTKEQLQQKIDAANDAIKQAQDALGDVKKEFDSEEHNAQLSLDSADKQRVDLTTQVENLKKEISGLSDKLSGRRVDVIDPMIRRPEGQILALGSANTVYINLGRGDGIVPGMTFEVYDKTVPLPKLGNGLSDENMPKGKASIEVTRVLPDGSECYISRIDAGQTLVQGDPILNLIYDRNVKFNFFVKGDFDINRSGNPTPAGADVVRRLIVQWGGKLQDAIGTDTDFVVMGAPPKLPPDGPDDLKDPIKAQEYAAAQKAAEDYTRIEQEAEALKIPILNQNKFFYLTGYYDLATR